MKKVNILLAMILVAGLLSACQAGAKPEVNTIIVEKSGEVTQVILEEFNQPYYDGAELQMMAEEEADNYNIQFSSGYVAVTVDSFEMQEGIARLHMKYTSAGDYAGFNEKEFFVGTISEAYDEGYEFVEMNSASDTGETLPKDAVLEKSSMNIVIFEEPVQVRLPAKVAYISGNLELIDSKIISAEGKEGLFYALY